MFGSIGKVLKSLSFGWMKPSPRNDFNEEYKYTGWF